MTQIAINYPNPFTKDSILLGQDVVSHAPHSVSYRGNTLIVGDGTSGMENLLRVHGAGICAKPDVALAVIDLEKQDALSHLEPRSTWLATTQDEARDALKDIADVIGSRKYDLVAAGTTVWSGNDIVVLIDGSWLLDADGMALLSEILRSGPALGVHVINAVRLEHLDTGVISSADRANYRAVMVSNGRYPLAARPSVVFFGILMDPAIRETAHRAHVDGGGAFDVYRLGSGRAADIANAFHTYRIPLARV